MKKVPVFLQSGFLSSVTFFMSLCVLVARPLCPTMTKISAILKSEYRDTLEFLYLLETRITKG